MKTTRGPVRPATPADLPAILALLTDAGLVTSGVAEHLPGFLVAADGANVVGSAGLEVYGDAALLRSVAVAAPHRGQGLGRRLVDAALAAARRHGARVVALLTTSAAEYFRAWGFREVERGGLDPRLAASAEFGAECCASAMAMELTLGAPSESTPTPTG